MIETFLSSCHGLAPDIASGNCALSHYTVAPDVPFASEIGLDSEYHNILVQKKWKVSIGSNIENIIGGIMIEPSGSVSRIAPAPTVSAFPLRLYVGSNVSFCPYA